MSEYGIKIKNYQAASVIEYGCGLRNSLDSTNAMLTNSLFLDFLLDNGLSVWKGESTRDVICLQFDYGTKGYQESLDKIKAMLDDGKDYLQPLYEHIVEHGDRDAKRISKEALRTKCYECGVSIDYENEILHYKMLYRTPGKAKKGTCMFIRDELYEVAHNFLYMGISLPENNAPIVEIGAYSSLITSSIVGRVKIEPKQILVLKDVDSLFKTNIVNVYLGDDGHCHAGRENDCNVVNTLFDGQALIDSSIFPEWADGYVLLRHHFTKCAAFSTNIELFMRDYFKDDYDSATVKDMWGRDVKVSDIKLITTNNAIKWLKFDISFDYWAKWVEANCCQFGIVKTAHESKLGNVQRMSYQMNNALDIDTMANTTAVSVDYINRLKTDDETFLDYLRKNQNFSNDYEVLLALVEHNPDFIRCDYFRERRYRIVQAYVMGFKSGHTIQNGDNLTIVGSPYAMLLHSVGEDPLSDPTLNKECGTIQCWTARFADGEYLAEFRNPFNSRNNLGCMHNHYHEYFDKYFNLGRLCIAVNMIETDFQSRNNGLTKWVS